MRYSTWKLFGILGVTLLIAAPARADIVIGVAGPDDRSAWPGSASRMQRGRRTGGRRTQRRGWRARRTDRDVMVDDYCDAEQAVAAAKKLVAERASPLVVGHQCSGAAIPASKVYADSRAF